MDVNLPAGLTKQVEQEIARQRAEQRWDALRRIGQAVDDAGLYERVLTPGQE